MQSTSTYTEDSDRGAELEKFGGRLQRSERADYPHGGYLEEAFCGPNGREGTKCCFSLTNVYVHVLLDSGRGTMHFGAAPPLRCGQGGGC